MKYFLILLLSLATSLNVRAYVLENIVWNISNPAMKVNLSASQAKLGAKLPRFPLVDGSGSFDAVFLSAIASWNSYLSRLQIVASSGSNVNGVDPNDNVSDAGFGATLGGSTLGPDTLAVTAIYYYKGPPNYFAPTDITFNSGFNWNSYRGPLSQTLIDMRRVALHELGHFIGLDHPDDAGQKVSAIMNSVISNTDQLTADDITGGQSMYAAATAPAVINLPTIQWNIAGAGDFNRDGKSDLVWENTSTGARAIWLLNNGVPSKVINLSTVPTAWRIAGVGDFDGDGFADLAWENTSTGARAIWLLNNGVPSKVINLPTVSTAWRVAAVGDFNGDGFADFVWENTSTGARAIWLLNNGVPSKVINLPTVALTWRIVGAGDFNRDGFADLVWENTNTGERAIWLLKNGVFAGAINLPTTPVVWHIAGTGDFNGDGNVDLAWENTSTGARAIWLLNNGVVSSVINLPTIP